MHHAVLIQDRTSVHCSSRLKWAGVEPIKMMSSAFYSASFCSSCFELGVRFSSHGHLKNPKKSALFAVITFFLMSSNCLNYLQSLLCFYTFRAISMTFYIPLINSNKCPRVYTLKKVCASICHLVLRQTALNLYFTTSISFFAT